jgi:hypothetical protein
LYKHPRALTPDIPLGLLNKLIFWCNFVFLQERSGKSSHT